MKSSRFPSLKFQIRTLFALALALSILVMGGIWIVYNRTALEHQAGRMYAIQAEMIGAAVKPAMMFGDKKLADELIDQIKSSPDIHSLRLYKADGTLLAAYPEETETTSESAETTEHIVSKHDTLSIEYPVMHKEAQVGLLHIEFDLSELTDRQRSDIVNIAFIILAILIFSLLVSLRLQRRLYESEKSLHQAIRKAEQANQAKSDFLSTMSHELRTPIHGIIGLHQLIGEEEENLSPEQLENLVLAQQSARSLRAMVNDILDLGKIESGNMELNESEYDLERLIHDAMVPFRVATLKKGIRLSLHIENAPRKVVGDEIRLRQVLLNLIGNAVKFTEQGEVSVSVNHIDDKLLFSVRDTGCGIADEDLPRIFEPFIQGRNSTRLTEKGTGLGTSIARKFIELMGGNISVESSDGGSCFSFEIPCRTVDDERIDISIASEGGLFRSKEMEKETMRSPYPSLRVLLAEDDPIGQRIATRLLSRAGIEVDTARNGVEALQKLRNGSYDLLLTDVAMPEMDGIELTRKIRVDEALSGKERLPIIGLSAHAMEDVARECLSAGMDNFMTKPVDPDTIILNIFNNASEKPDKGESAP